MCDHWKKTSTGKGIYRDVYDGALWREFQIYNRKPFLSDPFFYGLMLNIDWFRPCKYVEYSIGAIYLTIMNLPRTIRFRQENVMLIGLIPAPKQPKHDINSHLKPLVEELLQFWNGVFLNIGDNNCAHVRCALLCVAADVPASRKVCGFLGHAGVLGCSKCMKNFPGHLGSRDYSGFDRSCWPLCNNELHRRNVSCIQKSTTITQQTELESKLGCRYSALLELPYFDPVRMTIIDPMHNMFLGTTKHMLKNIWMKKSLVNDADLFAIQGIIDIMELPSYIGRIPYKIASSASSFTADQFKSWTCYFSIICLHDILPQDHVRCWQCFVLAARILCQMSVTHTEIELADALLLKFCRQVESLYGKSVITPNMHLHCHFKQCLLDYGPVHNLWHFAYERYNGILECYPTNHRSLEVQLMRRFFREFYQSLSLSHMPPHYQEELGEFMRTQFEHRLERSLKHIVHDKCDERFDPTKLGDWSKRANESDLVLPSVYMRVSLYDTMLSELKNVYSS